MSKISFQQLFPRANPDALDLLDRMLAFDPSQRIGVEEALEHRYLAIWHDASDEPACPTPFDFSFETAEDVSEMRQMILQEVKNFRQLVRSPQTVPFANQQGGQQQQVPIPEGYDPRTYEDPRPQEMAARMQGGDLERELQGGLDAMRQ
jgi:mitogen-activated protein kinase 7